jgi:hypothetical protein
MSASLCAVALLLSLHASPDFEPLSREDDGLTLEARDVEGTAFAELRVQGHVPIAPAALAALVWSGGPGPDEARYLEGREALSETEGLRLERQRVNAPLIGRRDSLVRFHRETDAQGTRVIQYALVGQAHGAAAPAMRVLRGTWRFSPDGAGGSFLEYRAVSDPGGLPAFLAHGAQRALALALVRDAISRAAQGKEVQR